MKEILSCLHNRIVIENKDNEEFICHPRRFRYKQILRHPFRLFNIMTGRELNLRYAEVVLTTACTLRCKGCSALIPLYPSTSIQHVDFDRIMGAIQRLANSVDFIHHLRLLGGEPLLYPNLYDVLCLIKDEKKIHKADVVTNGTLLIRDVRVLDILKDEKFYVKISDYGDYSNKKDKLIQQLKENDIRFVVYHLDYWKNYGDVTVKDCKKYELREKFLYCNELASRCKSVLYGKLYQCPRSAHGTELGLIPKISKDYVDLLDETISDKRLKKRIFTFMYKTPYTEACKYCNMSKNIDKIPVGSQI